MLTPEREAEIRASAGARPWTTDLLREIAALRARIAALEEQLRLLGLAANECADRLLLRNERITALEEAGEGLDERLKGFIPEFHHNRCDTRTGGKCDCFMQRYADDLAALARWREVREEKS